MAVITGESVPVINIRVVQGDTFQISMRREDADGNVIDTEGYDARAMIRSKSGARALICDLVVGGASGKGEIVLGIDGEGDDATNLSIIIPADVTAGFPRVSNERRASWEWDIEVISNPESPELTTEKWARGDVYSTNEVTYAS